MKIEEILKNKRIKMHLFLPSNRKIFTIVSNDEYWLDPDINFCSCKGYFFKYMRTNEECYHLKALRLADQSDIEVIRFSDKEYIPFIKALLHDLARYALD